MLYTINFSTVAPEGVLPPQLTILSSRSIEILFTNPLTPNGIITLYTITRLTPSPTTITFTPDNLPPMGVNGYYNYLDQNLNPFTTYTYSLTICTNEGCTESLVAMATTLEDTPTGIAAPVAISLSFSEIRMNWSVPEMPNGLIQSYHLLRKFIGFQVVEDSLNCCEDFIRAATPEGSGGNESSLADTCQLVSMTSAQQTYQVDDELRPYTFYQYCIVVTNNANSAVSPQTTPTRTEVAPMPLFGPELNATTINSTAIELVWGSLETSELLGPLVGYTLYIKFAEEEGIGEAIFSGLDQSYTAVDLLASTEYVFVVAVSNGGGVAFSNNASAITDEGSESTRLIPNTPHRCTHTHTHTHTHTCTTRAHTHTHTHTHKHTHTHTCTHTHKHTHTHTHTHCHTHAHIQTATRSYLHTKLVTYIKMCAFLCTLLLSRVGNEPISKRSISNCIDFAVPP